MKRKTKLLLTAATVFVACPVFLTAPGHASKRQRAPFQNHNFAHRGLHRRDLTVPENSLPAFERAASSGYGIELDVQLSKDGQVIVFHDDTLDRVCGVHAAVAEKTWEELSRLSLCGTEERIPLFSEVLKVIRGRGPLIVELKTGKRNRELCRKTYEILQGYKGDVCVESFDPTIVRWFRFHGKDLLRGQLATLPKNYKGYKAPVRFVLGNTLLNFMGRPQFIAYDIVKHPFFVRLAEALGAMKVCWTSHEPYYEKGNDAVIFEFYRPGTTYATQRSINWTK